jgi:Mce-associated membrane protein
MQKMARRAISATGIRYEVVMGETRKPAEETQDGDAVTSEVDESAAETETDLRARLAEAEADAAEAEAAAAVARSKVRAMRSQQDGNHADENGEDAENSRRRRLWPPSWPIVAKVVAAIVIVGSLAGSGAIVWQHHTAVVRRQHAEEFIQAATQGVLALTTIDFNTVKDQVQHIIDNSTGSFRDDFNARSDQFIKVAQASKAIAKGTVTAAAVESIKTDEAVVLVVGSEKITNAAGNQQPRAFRFRVTVTRDGGQLKVSKLELVL